MREYLKQLREERKITQSEVAQAIGISQCYYSAIENGTRGKHLSLMFLEKIADFYDVQLTQLINEEFQARREGA